MTGTAVQFHSVEPVQRHRASTVVSRLKLWTQQASSGSHLDAEVEVTARSVTASEFKKGPWSCPRAYSTTVTHSTLKPDVEDATIYDLTNHHKQGWLNPWISNRSISSRQQVQCQAFYTVTYGSEAWHDDIPASLL